MAKETALAVVHGILHKDEAVKQLLDYVPIHKQTRASGDAKQYIAVAYAEIANKPQLQKVAAENPRALLRAIAQSISQQLPVDGTGLAYLVPYGKDIQFQRSYLGLMELAFRSGKVKSFTAHVIRESERDKVKITRIDGCFNVDHPFSFDMATGEIIAVYATAHVEGIDPQTAVLLTEEVERYRKLSQAPNSPAWKNFYEAMAKKTAIRQLAKFLPKSILKEFHEAVADDARQDYGVLAEEVAERLAAQSGSRVVDTQFEDDPDKPEETKKQTRGRGRPSGSKNKGKDAGNQDANKDASNAQAGGTDNPGDGPKKFKCGSCGKVLVEGQDFEKNAGGSDCCKHCLSGDFTEITNE
ncbi:MAG: recombinase RecT [Planctomycetota bacterium]|jgi:recombination protein RecT